MLQPKRTKYRKMFRGSRSGLALRGSTMNFGEYAMKAQTHGWVSSKQIESARRTLANYTKRGGRIWIRIFPDKPITKKPLETRMGGGKGDITEYVAVVKPGRILFEMGAINLEIAKEAMRLASAKLPIKVKFITRD
ncbi:50S ribosomal protein L16 [Candidatus Microgenomates bacterium]|nr:MAG: 50S ribosomal protein L16 [Candidatus Microgenomates bacterium]